MKRVRLKQIPSVSSLLTEPGFKALNELYSQERVVAAIRQVLAKKREQLLSGRENVVLTADALLQEVKAILGLAEQPNLKKVINATGIVLHTNLGRAPLSQRAIEEVTMAAGGYCNLEMNLASGKRGSRYEHVKSLLCRLTGAESALVVNNNAAAVMLCLSTLAKGREVVISRGELVEIGGSFRIPEVMEQSGACLKEVGATNKTHLKDYVKAIGEATALILKVHTSNYRMQGFTKSVEIKELVQLAAEQGLPVMEDLGSGILLDCTAFKDEPTVRSRVAEGVDILTFSGDKLLGGPQAGIILGKEKYLKRMQENPLLRALRIDKLSLAALEGTLLDYLNERLLAEKIPVWRMLQKGESELLPEAELLAGDLREVLQDKAEVEVVSGFSEAGGGSLPTVEFPTCLVKVKPLKGNEEGWANRLRQNAPPVLLRRQSGCLLLDPRTLLEGDRALLKAAFAGIEGE